MYRRMLAVAGLKAAEALAARQEMIDEASESPGRIELPDRQYQELWKK